MIHAAAELPGRLGSVGYGTGLLLGLAQLGAHTVASQSRPVLTRRARTTASRA